MQKCPKCAGEPGSNYHARGCDKSIQIGAASIIAPEYRDKPFWQITKYGKFNSPEEFAEFIRKNQLMIRSKIIKYHDL